MKKTSPVSLRNVVVNDPVFAPAIRSCHEKTIPASIERCRETGRIKAFRLDWKPGMPDAPHIFWDSDLAKVLEGMAYAIMLKPDAAMESELNSIVDLVVSAQQKDGYLNTHYTVVEPEKRWTCINGCHELYCAGHLIEAAVAHHRATGKTNFLDAMCRYADYIGTVFGTGAGQRAAYPGHEEIELALCKLADETGNQKYLEIAKYFVDERGKKPTYFETVENVPESALANNQSHKPVREQTEAVGHAVRAVYLYSGMADVAERTNDAGLLHACKTLFESISERKMYITGGIGSTSVREAFGLDYQLPNDTAYAESCAAIGLVLFANRMLNITGEGRYADVMEQVMYNNALSGISLEGDSYFYPNMLEVNELSPFAKTRSKWFGCSCCPTNYCRYLPQAGSFLWSESDDSVQLNIPAAGEYRSGNRAIRVTGAYPYSGDVAVDFLSDAQFEFRLRIPAWCKKFSLSLNGKKLDVQPKNGFVTLSRDWKNGDSLAVELDMPVRKVHANPRVHEDAGKFALMRGPVVYTLESTENGTNLSRLRIPADAKQFKLGKINGLPSGIPSIEGPAEELVYTDTQSLYTDEPVQEKSCRFTAIPYAFWQNRGETEMQVWIRE